MYETPKTKRSRRASIAGTDLTGLEVIKFNSKHTKLDSYNAEDRESAGICTGPLIIYL